MLLCIDGWLNESIITIFSRLFQIVKIKIRRRPSWESLPLSYEVNTKLMELVLTARGVITDQTVGLSNPVSLLAPEILFMKYL